MFMFQIRLAEIEARALKRFQSPDLFNQDKNKS